MCGRGTTGPGSGWRTRGGTRRGRGWVGIGLRVFLLVFVLFLFFCEIPKNPRTGLHRFDSRKLFSPVHPCLHRQQRGTVPLCSAWHLWCLVGEPCFRAPQVTVSRVPGRARVAAVFGGPAVPVIRAAACATARGSRRDARDGAVPGWVPGPWRAPRSTSAASSARAPHQAPNRNNRAACAAFFNFCS
jgi:hypothetical protein